MKRTPTALAIAIFLFLLVTASNAVAQDGQVKTITTTIDQQIKGIGAGIGTILTPILAIIGALLVVLAFVAAFLQNKMMTGLWYLVGALGSFAIAGIVKTFLS